MKPCPCRRRPTHHICPQWTSPLLTCQGPKSLLDCYVAASASPPSLSTLRPPQRCRRSRGMSLTLSCPAARTPATKTTQKPGPLDGTAICSPRSCFPLPPLKPPLSCSDAAVEHGTPCLPRHWGFRMPPVCYIQTLRRPHWFCAPASLHPRGPVQWRDYSCPAGAENILKLELTVSTQTYTCVMRPLDLKATQTASQTKVSLKRGEMSRTTNMFHMWRIICIHFV